jgi:carbamoyltransferase
MNLILGLNAYHGDASACLVRDGVLIAAAEEERFRRIKHWAGFPTEAIRYCLRQAGVRLSDIDHLAINSDPKAQLYDRFLFALRNRPNVRLVLLRLRSHGKRLSIATQLSTAFPGDHFHGEIHRVEHHLAHLASAFLVSPFAEAVVASVDGFGDFASTAWGVGRGSTLAIDGRVLFPHSLGAFYQAMTQYLGFPHYGDEYKVMGLAPYGQPTEMDKMRRIVRLNDGGVFSLDLNYFRYHKERIDYEWFGGAPHADTMFSPALEDLLGPARGKDETLSDRYRNIARSVQAMYEEAFFHLLEWLHEQYRLTDLTLAGGCAMNSVANGKVRRRSAFKRLYVQSAAGDAGGAIGAAICVSHKLGHGADKARAPCRVLAGDAPAGRFIMEHAYWGPDYGEEEIARLISANAKALNESAFTISEIRDDRQLCRRTAKLVAEGLVVGWFKGRLEWGPRALGNRSIVCDPRRADMKNILNLKIKRRESFRPFAPSILREHVAEWFEEDDDVPFMMQVHQIREEKRALIPAVTHVDGSGRLQTVHRATNACYWILIDAFRELTGVPIVLNTSFNENEPVVCRAQEALDCFLRTNMDVLVLGSFLIERRSTA